MSKRIVIFSEVSLRVDGKMFLRKDSPTFLKVVTYGPFPAESPHAPERDFPQITAGGFDTVRVYDLPDGALLDEAHRHELLVIPTLPWAQGVDFIARPHYLRQAHDRLCNWLQECGTHSALGALLIGNEIPSEMARWMGPAKVRQALDELILAAQARCPTLPVGYASFPTTEYLEPERADFTAFNLYLEDPAALAAYLPRLHHLAGDRPVLLTEFGLDTQRHSEEEQSELFRAAVTTSHQAGLAGFTAYAWSDHWFNNQQVVEDWSFGLFRRDGSAKPALATLTRELAALSVLPVAQPAPKISVIICTRNGAHRLPSCLNALAQLRYSEVEFIVVNDGSTDGTRELLDCSNLPSLRVLHLAPGGLSTARNAGAAEATGEIFAFTDDDCQPDPHWLDWLAHSFTTTSHAAIGGPNLPPEPKNSLIAVSATAPGAPTHVMLSDTEAEHLPGCNIAIRREAFEEIDGFDPIFRTAGDDVDVCWRLRDAGYTLGFCGAAFVWHDRRPTPWRYLKQQLGYGKAEALLYHKHPERFTRGGRGGIRWEGCVYHGAALSVSPGDTIYTGPSGEGAYQHLVPRVQPVRPLPTKYDTLPNRLLLRLLRFLQAHLRPWNRHRHGGPPRLIPPRPPSFYSPEPSYQLTFSHRTGMGRADFYRALRALGWFDSPHTDYDLTVKGAHLLAATEQSGESFTRTHIRVLLSPTATDPGRILHKLALSLGMESTSHSRETR